MKNNYRFIPYDLIIYRNTILCNFLSHYDIESYNNLELIDYRIEDKDTPENICDRLYNDSSLSWIIFFFNDIIDPFFDWPLNTKELNEYCIQKYGVVIDNYSSIYGIHHYEKDGYIVNSNVVGATPINNLLYETKLNDSKRLIKLPTPNLVSKLLSNINV